MVVSCLIGFANTQKGEKMSETYVQGTPTETIRIRNDLVRTVREVHLAKESIEEIADAVVEKLKLPSVQPEPKEIGYTDCAYAMVRMWIDNVLTDGEYSRIMDKLNAHWAERREDGNQRKENEDCNR